MTKYTGLIRTLAGFLLVSTVGLSLVIPNMTKHVRGSAVAEPEPVAHEKKIEIPDPPVIENGGKEEFEDWVDRGMPGYIPDPGSVKNGNAPDAVKPMVEHIQVECTRAPASALGLSPNAAQVYEAVCALFPEVTSFGGLRVGDPLDHGSGNAIDCMIDSVNGDVLAQWLIDHWKELPLKYIIWEQRISYGGEWESMADRGSPTQNHYDHVHISVL